MFDGMKTFLSSPRSLEPIEPVKKTVRKEKINKKRRSIYEETDYSKLTRRQFLLNQRYQKQKGDVMDIAFLLYNNLPMDHLFEKKRKTSKKSCMSKFENDEECIHEKTEIDKEQENDTGKQPNMQGLDTEMEFVNDFNESNTHMDEENDEVGLQLNIKELHSDEMCKLDEKSPRSIFEEYNICEECFVDAAKTYAYLEEMSYVHKCRYEKLIMMHKCKIRQSFRDRVCFSKIRDEEARFVDMLRRTNCCNAL